MPYFDREVQSVRIVGVIVSIGADIVTELLFIPPGGQIRYPDPRRFWVCMVMRDGGPGGDPGVV